MSALILDKCVFLHVPKTGGTWALAALRAQGVVLGSLDSPEGQTHPSLATVRAVTDRPVIAAVRDPVEWLRSFWRFFYARNWRPSGHAFFEPLLVMQTDSFAEFAQRYIQRRAGYVSELLATFAEGAEAVCRQERLVDDLTAALERFGQDYVRQVFDRTPRENVSRRFEASCPPDVEAKIRDADRWLLEEFYRRAA